MFTDFIYLLIAERLPVSIINHFYMYSFYKNNKEAHYVLMHHKYRMIFFLDQVK